MDYSQLSDFEINRMVGDIIFKAFGQVNRKHQGITPTNGITKCWYNFWAIKSFAWLLQWSGASWPIIEKYRISILDQLTEGVWMQKA